jgi:heme-degrading monooxygenase HmoA
MHEIYTSGSWKVNPGSEEAFVEAWADFAAFASGEPGGGTLRLLRNLAEPDRFLSFGEWESIEAATDWKSSDGFREQLGRVLEHSELQSSDLALVVSAEAGAATTHSRVATA